MWGAELVVKWDPKPPSRPHHSVPHWRPGGASFPAQLRFQGTQLTSPRWWGPRTAATSSPLSQECTDAGLDRTQSLGMGIAPQAELGDSPTLGTTSGHQGGRKALSGGGCKSAHMAADFHCGAIHISSGDMGKLRHGAPLVPKPKSSSSSQSSAITPTNTEGGDVGCHLPLPYPALLLRTADGVRDSCPVPVGARPRTPVCRRLSRAPAPRPQLQHALLRSPPPPPPRPLCPAR